MVYRFDPKYFNGTIFTFDGTASMSGDWDEYEVANQPIPASCFPKNLTIERAYARLPDLFHWARGIIVVSERARLVLERLAPGQLEFIPVVISAPPTTWLAPLAEAYHVIKEFGRMAKATLAPGSVPYHPAVPWVTARLKLARAYYFINVLGRAQRLQWLEMPTQKLFTREDGTEIFMILPGLRDWILRERAGGEPLIWHETDWQFGNREYRAHSIIFIEDVLWQELDARFPNQLNALRVGE